MRICTLVKHSHVDDRHTLLLHLAYRPGVTCTEMIPLVIVAVVVGAECVGAPIYYTALGQLFAAPTRCLPVQCSVHAHIIIEYTCIDVRKEMVMRML